MITPHWNVLWSLALAVVTAGWCVLAMQMWLTRRIMPDLSDFPGAAGTALPSLSVIVPARDEAPDIERTVRSLAAQQYPGLEIICVDDRSADGTGEIMQALAAELPAVRALRVRELPPGWLGKNHACWLGAGRARGEDLLFTDGDVVFAPGALASAQACRRVLGVGHLTAFPHMISTGVLERAFQAAFALAYVVRFRLWGLSRPGTRAYAGVGAFNLVDRREYLRVGGHRRLAMEVVDDVKLGLILRRGGVRQGCAVAGPLVAVRWQPGFRASLLGLQKNLFAGVEYRWGRLLLGLASGMAAVWGPWALLALAPEGLSSEAVSPDALSLETLSLGTRSLAALFLEMRPRLATLAPIVLGAVLHMRAATFTGGRGLAGLAYPVALTALMGAALASAVLTTWRGGIRWRGTFYSLAELKAGCVREADFPPAGAPGWERP